MGVIPSHGSLETPHAAMLERHRDPHLIVARIASPGMLPEAIHCLI
jgi:hypothetical protein